MEANIHRDMFSLFYSAWSNPDTKVHQIVKYLLDNSNDNSRTWSANLKHISRMYDIEDPSSLMLQDPPSKAHFKNYILTKITVFHEKELRNMATNNSKIEYFNVPLFGLLGRVHKALSGVSTAQEVSKMKSHLKMLSGNYLTYKTRAEQSGGSP